MPKDIDQASKMLNMRIKVDVWSKGIDESIRIEIREHVQELFCQLPARRVWFYLKDIRHMLLKRNEPEERAGSQLDMDDLMEGPEDIIANGKSLVHTTVNLYSDSDTTDSKSIVPC